MSRLVCYPGVAMRAAAVGAEQLARGFRFVGCPLRAAAEWCGEHGVRVLFRVVAAPLLRGISEHDSGADRVTKAVAFGDDISKPSAALHRRAKVHTTIFFFYPGVYSAKIPVCQQTGSTTFFHKFVHPIFSLFALSGLSGLAVSTVVAFVHRGCFPVFPILLLIFS